LLNVVPSGDFAPRSAVTLRPSMANESLGTPGTGLTGTRMSVARTRSMLSRRNAGSATRRRLRADGTPPTVKLESMAAEGGVNTKLSKRVEIVRLVDVSRGMVSAPVPLGGIV